jgi:hypothetical protein
MKKVTKKSSHTGCFFAAQGHMRCKAGKTSGPVLLPPVVAQGPALQAKLPMPVQRTAHLVLPPFTRSCPYDGVIYETK